MTEGLLARLERYYDAVPRSGARVEEHESLRLFVKEGDGWPYYARPALDARAEPTGADVRAVRERQRELGVPETFEWVAETTPALLEGARSAGLRVDEVPLMVLGEGRWRTPDPPAEIHTRLLEPEDPALAAAQGVAHVAFAHPGTQPGKVGTTERDEIAAHQTPRELARLADRIRRGLTLTVVAEAADGPLAVGSHQPVGYVTEIVGVGTLPVARRLGLGASVTGQLVADARARGVDVVFLSAGSEEIARVYARLGFERVGTACLASPA